jgi:hypothetical protein
VKTLLFLILVAGGAYAFVNHVSLSSGNVRTEGRHTVVDADEIEVRFLRAGAASESLMVFGGTAERRRNSFTDATMSTLESYQARAISQRYPDFHKCASPGAAQAKRLIETTHFVAANGGIRRKLAKAVEEHDRRVGSGGDRMCVGVRGQELVLDSIRVKENGMDITQQFAPHFAGSQFLLAESVETPDCRTLLR